MKEVVILVLIIVVCFIVATVLDSAQARGLTSTTDTGHSVVMKTVYDSGSDHAVVIIEFEGHKYIGLHKGGITHCASCPCHPNH